MVTLRILLFFSSVLGICHSFAADTIRRIDISSCAYSGQALKVPASDYFLRIVKKITTHDVCLRKVLCTNPQPTFEFPDWIPEYETFVFCLPDSAGRCTQAFETCKTDDAVDDVDRSKSRPKIRDALGIKENGATR